MLSSFSESEKKLINFDIVVLKLRTKKQAQKKYQDGQHNMQHTMKKNDLSGLGLDPSIVVETGEKLLSFALGSVNFSNIYKVTFEI